LAAVLGLLLDVDGQFTGRSAHLVFPRIKVQYAAKRKNTTRRM